LLPASSEEIILVYFLPFIISNFFFIAPSEKLEFKKGEVK
jgi:hypothetical protein